MGPRVRFYRPDDPTDSCFWVDIRRLPNLYDSGLENIQYQPVRGKDAALCRGRITRAITSQHFCICSGIGRVSFFVQRWMGGTQRCKQTGRYLIQLGFIHFCTLLGGLRRQHGKRDEYNCGHNNCRHNYLIQTMPVILISTNDNSTPVIIIMRSK